MPISLRKKLIAIAIVGVVFELFALILAPLIGAPLDQALLTAACIGVAVSSFEEFYVHGAAGRTLRAMHPIKSILIYTAFVCIVAIIGIHLTHVALGRVDRLVEAYARFPTALAMIIAVSLVGVLVLRVIGFIGTKTLFHLLVGRYHRPVMERKVILFLDMRNFTGFVEELGPLRAKERQCPG